MEIKNTMVFLKTVKNQVMVFYMMKMEMKNIKVILKI